MFRIILFNIWYVDYYGIFCKILCFIYNKVYYIWKGRICIVSMFCFNYDFEFVNKVDVDWIVEEIEMVEYIKKLCDMCLKSRGNYGII